MEIFEGERFDRLEIISYIGQKQSGKVKQKYYLCKCDCGNYCQRSKKYLHSKTYASCGCYKLESLKKAQEKRIQDNLSHKTHGKSKTRIYRIYGAMKSRCQNPHNKYYSYYGGRGISICQEWDKFENFNEWAMANGYSDELTLDRVDFNKDYSPDNCRWVTRKQQMDNTRKTRLYEMNGEIHCLKDWGRIYNIPWATLWYRMNKGMSLSEALCTPIRSIGKEVNVSG